MARSTAHTLARRLIRLARSHGAKFIEVSAGCEGPIDHDQDESSIVRAMCDETDEALLSIYGAPVLRYDESTVHPLLTRLLWIPGNDHEAIVDWICTKWAHDVLDPFLQVLINEDAAR